MKKPRIIQLLMVLVLLLIFDCRKKEDVPAKPSNLTAAIISEDEIDLSWSDNSDNESGFKLERSKSGGTDWTIVSSIGKDISAYKNTGLEAGTSYSFKVMAFNAAGNSEYSNIASVNTPVAIVYSLAIITTSAVSTFTQTTAETGGNIVSDGNSPILARGVCWNTSANPTVSNSKTSNGGGTGSFSSSIPDLSPNTLYYIRAYATNSVGTSYGEQLTLTTLAALPVTATLVSTEITSFNSSSAISGGIISADGGAPITARGVCWGTSESPTIQNDTTLNGSGTGTFISNLYGLSGSTQYFVRAYAVNSAGTAYGNQVTVTTSTPSAFVPVLTTASGTSITSISAVSGGNISSDNGFPVTTRGICRSSSPNPTIAGYTTSNGTGTGNFISSLTGLTPGTKYYIRAYAINSQGIGYGDEVTITTGSVTPPSATSAAATSISASSATLNGSLNANGTETSISFEYGSTFMYGSTISASPAEAAGITPVTALAIVTGLMPNTLYHFRLKAVNAGGTVYGDDMTFSTLVPPSSTTMEAKMIYPTTARLTGSVNANGNETSVKFEYGTTSSYGIILFGVPDKINGSSEFPVKVDLTGLTKSTTYHFRIVAENRVGVIYGNDMTFTTLENDPVIPTLSTSAVTEITSATATGGGNITSDGGGEVTSRGICYSTSVNPTLDNGKTINGTGTGVFASPFTGLTPGTLYYVKAYATNMVGTAYGNEVSFTSLPPGAELPAVTTTTVSAITHNTASCGGEITDDGGGLITARGVCWSTSENPTTGDSKTNDGTGTGIFISSIAGLDANTIYHIRSYATNSAGTAYGEQIDFTTSDPPAGLATLTTIAGSDITNSSATSGGNISGDGGSGITERGVCWSITPGPTIADSKTSNGTGTGVFSSNINGISPGTQYYIRAFATNDAGTAYGNQITITTLAPDPVLPTVTTASVTTITYNSGSGGGDVTDEGNASVTSRGVCWSLSSNPTIDNSNTTNGTGPGTFTSSITGLNYSSTYYVRAYASNTVGTAYGNEVSFTTPVLPFTVPTLTTTTATGVTFNSASTGGNISSNGGDPVSAKGVCYSTSANPSLGNNFSSNGTGNDPFTSILTDLSANTTYYVKAYATNEAGTAYGNEISFTTPVQAGAPVLITTSASSVGISSATSGGNITDDGDGAGPTTITARGVCWSTSPNPTTLNSKTSDGAGIGIYSSSLTGLVPCTTYHIRAYATNSSDYTAYGADLTFKTSSVLPSVSTTALTAPTSSSVSTGGTVSGDCSETVTEKGVCYGTSTGPTTDGSKIIYATGGSGSYSISITRLTPCTTYFIRAYAINSSGTGYGNQLSFTTSTALSTVATTNISSITSTSASTGGTVSGDCTSGATRGICYGLSANPTTKNSVITAGTNGTGSYTISITGLTPCTTYYVRAYVTNSAGSSYGRQQIFTTSTVTASITTTVASSITAYTAVSGGTISGSCGSAVTAKGVCWSTSTGPTIESSPNTNNGSGSGSFTSNITGLSRTTLYYYRAYATNAAGTVYGTQYSFTTLAIAPTVSTSATASIIANTYTTCGGDVTSDGGATVTAKGVCWSTSINPTISNSITTDGTGTGAFTSSIAGLSPGTSYFVRAYATNSGGTGYGINKIFSTPPTVTDWDGNLYNSVSYNGAVWMQSNLKVTHYNNGGSMHMASDTSQWGGYDYYHSYNDNATYAGDYGYMYGGNSITTNICPTGWHVPTISEWSVLASALGGYSVAGKKMNDMITTLIKKFPTGFQVVLKYWNNSMTGHDNSSLFSGRGGGGYYSYGDQGLKETSYWWTSSSLKYVRIDYNHDALYGISPNLQGFSDQAFYIRCKKD